MTVIVESILIERPAQAVFKIYEDVANWHQWDPDTKAATIDGPFRTGAKGRLTPSKGFAVPMEFVSVVPDRLFTVRSRAPACLMNFEHILTPTATGVIAVHRVTFSGPLGGFFGALVGARVKKGLPVTMARLKALAESA